MLSKSQLKLINSLKHKKYRLSNKLFVAEGIKTVQELINSEVDLVRLYLTTMEIAAPDHLCTIISSKELKRISFLSTPQKVFGLFQIPDPKPIDHEGLIIALDSVSDPGNLGTIIRLCDWFGVKDLVCSPDTVDCYNPKVVQATMGSIARVNVTYTELGTFLGESEKPSYGTFMEGEIIYNSELPDSGVIVFGNEAHGISDNLKGKIKKAITIPQFSVHQQTESLNVANAVAIVLSEFRRTSTGK